MQAETAIISGMKVRLPHLRALLIALTVAGIAIIAAIMVWRASAKSWIRLRHEALEWADGPHDSDGVILAFRWRHPRTLPWSLRLWGEGASERLFN